MLNVPFPKAVLDAQVRIAYDNDKYRVCVGDVIIGTYSFCLSVAKDFNAIESCIDEHVTKNPHLLRFYSNAGDSDTCLIAIPGGEYLITEHIKHWCYNWNISIIDLMDLNAIVEKFGNDTGTLNLIPTRTNNDGYLNGRIHYSGGIDYNLIGTGTVSTTTDFYIPQSQRNYSLSVAFNMNTQFKLSYVKHKALTDNMLPLSQQDIQEATISMPMLRHKFLPLFTLSGINTKLRYLFKDILNMSKAKYSYFVECVDEILKSGISVEYMADIATLHGVDIGQMHRQHLEVMAKDNPIMYRVLYHRSEVIRELIDKLPKFVEDYPFPSGYAIPNISAKPQTAFQWAITNQLAKRKISIQESLRNLDMNFIKDVKENTKLLLPGIHADDKALLMFLKYRGMLDEEGNYKKMNNERGYPSSESMDNDVYVYGMSHSDLIDECNKMLDLISDGVDLYERYPDPIEVDDYGIIRLSPVKGTMLKQVRNAIFNHRIEAKITLEQRLKLLRESGNEDDLMKCQVELPEALEVHRIKYKTELITIGKIMGHCIGNYTNSDNYFFRKDSVCAEVNSKTLKVKQCYDKKNTTTEDSTEFKNWLNDQFVIWWATQHQELTENLEFEMSDAEEQGNIQQLRALFEKFGYSTIFGGVDNAIIGGRDQAVYGYNHDIVVGQNNNYHRIDEDVPMENPYEGQQANARNIRQLIQAGELAPIQAPAPIELPINDDFNIM